MACLYTKWAYALILVISLGGLALFDWRYRLLLWRSLPSRQATFATLGCMLVFYLLWDIAGIWLKIFSTNPRYVLGLYLGSPDLPIEEVFFLTLLTYVILLAARLVNIYEERRATAAHQHKTKAKRASKS